MTKRQIGLNRYVKRFKTLVKYPFFWNLTILGNSIILLGSLLLYMFEHDPEKNPLAYIDCLLWSAETITTVGHGYYSPLTVPGKITLLILMLMGPLFLWSYMGFLMTALIGPELYSLEKDVHKVEKEVQDLISKDTLKDSV